MDSEFYSLVPNAILTRLAELADHLSDVVIPDECRPFAGEWKTIKLPTSHPAYDLRVEIAMVGSIPVESPFHGRPVAEGIEIRVVFNGGQLAGRHVFRWAAS